jgi:AAA+ superfamily predicted ATPase
MQVREGTSVKNSAQYQDVLQDLYWMGGVLKRRIEDFFANRHSPSEINNCPKLRKSPYSALVKDFDPRERLTLILVLAPVISPAYLDALMHESLPKAGDFPQIGGFRGKNFRGFLPTLETAVFLLGGHDMTNRIAMERWLLNDCELIKKRTIRLEEVEIYEPVGSSVLYADDEVRQLIISGKQTVPRFSGRFPARHIRTDLSWDDLVLSETTKSQIREIELWIRYSDKLMDEYKMRHYVQPGYSVLFYGPPGTGKTLTATLLGKYTGRDVFKIDLSTIVSKYIGETEKNLSHLFDKAENKDWILFFDEADALFGKRTQVRDAHDKYANQEVSYLLQRIESYNGLVILATNFRGNIDDAFTRRFQNIIHFPMPKPPERLKIWEKTIPEKILLDSKISLRNIAESVELSGSNIVNILRFVSIMAIDRGDHVILKSDLEEGIRRELTKEGRML